MEKYTIYCTKKQTKKALELGAPIGTCGYYYKQQVGCNTISDTDLHIIPTAEQMIGWLEETFDEIIIEQDAFSKWEFQDFYKGVAVGYGEYYSSRKEATLAAIDAALDYLSKNKK